MESHPYPIPEGVYAVPDHLLDLRPDTAIDDALLHPAPVTSEKNIWFFWHRGLARMPPHARRTVRAWHRRFSRAGWAVRVLDREPGSPLNVARFLDVDDRAVFPRAFAEGAIAGRYAPQHTSDLVRWPLLLRYGGVYADVGLLQIGDLDRVWDEVIANPASPFEVLSNNIGGGNIRNLTNYFLMARPSNPFFERCHRLLLKLWAEDGGKTTTDGMHTHPLLKGTPLMEGDYAFEEDGKKFTSDEVRRMLADYIIQGHVMTLVMGLVDTEDGWDGPRYAAEHIFAIDYMVGSQLINDMTAWDGPRQFELMSLPLPSAGEAESADQARAREIVEACLQRSFSFKLATGLINRVMGDTLGSLWRDNQGSDDVPWTYAHWLRHGTIYWSQRGLPERLDFQVIEPYRIGPLLRED